MKTIYLVTGAAGFMGTNVCAQLLERGDAVRAFVLKGDPAVKFMPKAVEIFEGDLCSAEDCEKFFVVEPGVQTVCIHCASMVTINPNYSEKLIAVNVGGTENMLNAAKNHPECKKFVYVSSTGAIPELPKGESIRASCAGASSRAPPLYHHSPAAVTARYLGVTDEKIEQLQSAIATESQNAADAEKWIALMKECVNPTELTAELLNTLIEKIVVHEAVKGEDGSREQEVEIFYRFIGKID